LIKEDFFQKKQEGNKTSSIFPVIPDRKNCGKCLQMADLIQWFLFSLVTIKSLHQQAERLKEVISRGHSKYSEIGSEQQVTMGNQLKRSHNPWSQNS